jgi:hypothetical protein
MPKAWNNTNPPKILQESRMCFKTCLELYEVFRKASSHKLLPHWIWLTRCVSACSRVSMVTTQISHCGGLYSGYWLLSTASSSHAGESFQCFFTLLVGCESQILVCVSYHWETEVKHSKLHFSGMSSNHSVVTVVRTIVSGLAWRRGNAGCYFLD